MVRSLTLKTDGQWTKSGQKYITLSLGSGYLTRGPVNDGQIVIIIDHRLGGVAVERPLREVAGSIPGRVIPNTLNIVVLAVFFGAQGCAVSITTDWLVSE